jgi:hypothetical protein
MTLTTSDYPATGGSVLRSDELVEKGDVGAAGDRDRLSLGCRQAIPS